MMKGEFGQSHFGETEAGEAYDKRAISAQLDAFTKKNGLRSLQDRLRIGLNEVAILAFNKTDAQVQDIARRMTKTPEESQQLYKELTTISVDIQKNGPWGYVEELSQPNSDAMRLWFMLSAAESMGYEREMDLNDAEFTADIQRIEGYLTTASNDPDAFFQKAHAHMVKTSEQAIRFSKDDKLRRVPMGEGFGTFLPMAIKGYEAGVVQDAEGDVFVGARGEIDDLLLTSVGLQKETGPDDRDPKRTVTYYVNDQGQKVIKKIHPGLLVVLSRSFELASSVVRALNDKQEVLEVAQGSLGHLRVIQTSEKERMKTEQVVQASEGFELPPPTEEPLKTEPSKETALSHPREEFYQQMYLARCMNVYLDALHNLTLRRKKDGRTVSQAEQDALGKEIFAKMEQKVDELRHINGILEQELPTMPNDIHSVIDMAGGAGDLGLAVSNELLSRGHDVTRTEIVDPQEGVAKFMKYLIAHLPFRKKMEKITVHNTGYLQDAKITPDALVVAKHACGTLTDSIIKQWRESESKMLVAMTCCQDKAHKEPSSYGFRQEDWSRLCKESALTNTTVPEEPGPARDKALQNLETGKRAMTTLDMARVEYLRRHGFKAELLTTDKFPKGDVIVARRLPSDFLKTKERLDILQKKDPLRFDAVLMAVDVRAAGGAVKNMPLRGLGDGWEPDDFAELARRFVPEKFEARVPVHAGSETPPPPNAGEESKEAKKAQKELLQKVFGDVKGRLDVYVRTRAQQASQTLSNERMGSIIKAIQLHVFRNANESPENIRTGVDVLMAEMTFE